MRTCSHCEGFVPQPLTACPHCDEATPIEGSSIERAAKGVVAAAGTAAMMASLMACYGLPMEAPVGCNAVTPLGEDGFVSDELPGGNAVNDLAGSCGGDDTPERIYRYEPTDEEFGSSGTLLVFWQSDESSTVYVLDDCAFGNELACDGGNAGDLSGQLELSFESFEGADIVFDGEGNYQLQVIYNPTAPAPGN